MARDERRRRSVDPGSAAGRPCGIPWRVGWAVAWAAVAGGGGEGKGGGAATGGDSAGPPEARGAGPPVRRLEGRPPAWPSGGRLKLVRELRGVGDPGSRSGRPPRPGLTRVRDLDATGDGGLLVLDGPGARVVVLDAAGTVARVVGRRGPGPGELRTPDRVEPGPEGGVLVGERRPPALHAWDREGTYRGATGLVGEATGSGSGAEDGRRAAATALADWGPRLPEGRAVRLVRLDPADPSRSRSAVHVAGPSGRIGAAAARWTTPGTASRLPEAFGARTSWTAAVAPDGSGRIVLARGDRYELRFYDTRGRLRTVVRRDREPQPVTAALRERAVERFVQEAERAGAPTSLTRRLRGEIPVADVLPVVGGLWSSPRDGRVWVGLPEPGGRTGPVMVVAAYDVYEADGRYLGRVPSPPGFRLHRVRGRRLYGTWRDSLDLPGIRTYRLVGPGRPSGADSVTPAVPTG